MTACAWGPDPSAPCRRTPLAGTAACAAHLVRAFHAFGPGALPGAAASPRRDLPHGAGVARTRPDRPLSVAPTRFPWLAPRGAEPAAMAEAGSSPG